MHTHASVDYTSLELEHVHQCLDITYPPTPAPNGTPITRTKKRITAYACTLCLF
jgi:hypothetical protein